MTDEGTWDNPKICPNCNGVNEKRIDHWEIHAEPIRNWRDCHACAKMLLERLANGWLAHDAAGLQATKERMLVLAREIIRDDNVPRDTDT